MRLVLNLMVQISNILGALKKMHTDKTNLGFNSTKKAVHRFLDA